MDVDDDAISDEDDNDNDDDVPLSRLRSHAGDDDDSERGWVDYDPKRHAEPFVGEPGVNVLPARSDDLAAVVDMFIDDEIFAKIATATNDNHRAINHLYANRATRSGKWREVDAGEIRTMLALCLLMFKMRKRQKEAYWSTNQTIETPIFSEVMPRGRFFDLLKFFDFGKSNGGAKTLDEFRHVVDYFVQRFRSVYRPRRHLAMSEPLILWRGARSSREGCRYNVYGTLLAESDTGYVCNVNFCAKPDLKDNVVDLLKPFTGLWHHVYFVEYDTSTRLAEALVEEKIRICALMSLNRGLPRSYVSLKRQHPSESLYRRKDEVLIQTWRKGKNFDVQFVSTIHNADVLPTDKFDANGERIYKPSTAIDYAKHIWGAYRVDHTHFSVFNKNHKWTKKLFFYLVKCSLYNAYCVYVELNPTSPKLKYKEFIVSVLKLWLNRKYRATETVSDNEFMKPTCHSLNDPPGRISKDFIVHRLKKIVSAKSNKTCRRLCRVCKKHNRRRETSFMCAHCFIPLHHGQCHLDYHSKIDY